MKRILRYLPIFGLCLVFALSVIVSAPSAYASSYDDLVPSTGPSYELEGEDVSTNVPDSSSAVYQSLYQLLHTYVYGDADLSPDMSLTLTLAATIGALFLVSIPFIVVFIVIRRFC